MSAYRAGCVIWRRGTRRHVHQVENNADVTSCETGLVDAHADLDTLGRTPRFSIVRQTLASSPPPRPLPPQRAARRGIEGSFLQGHIHKACPGRKGSGGVTFKAIQPSESLSSPNTDATGLGGAARPPPAAATFSVTAPGNPLDYQWNRNGTAIPGATAASYTTPATVAADQGALFSVVVANSAGSATSSAVTIHGPTGQKLS